MSNASRLFAGAVILMATSALACGDDTPTALPLQEVVEVGEDCFDIDRSPSLNDGLQNTSRPEGCLARLGADPVGRLFLIGVVNADLASAILYYADGLRVPSKGLAAAADEVRQGVNLTGAFDDADSIHVGLSGELREHQDEREMAVDLGGLLSLLPDSTSRRIVVSEDTRVSELAIVFIEGDALARTEAAIARVEALLPDKDWEDEFIDLASTAVADSFAVALWAQPPVREALVAQGASPPPTSAGATTIAPPLADATGALRIPGPDEREARAAFDAWYRDGGGRPLRVLAMSFPEKVRIKEIGADETTPLIEALFSPLLDPQT